MFSVCCVSRSADHRDAAGHEFGEGIADASQDPELRGVEAGIVLRHRHPARPDVSRDIDLPLGHGVAHAVGGIAADDDPGSGIEPAHVVGGGTHHVDQGVGKSHRTDPLPRCPQDADVNGLIPRLPETPADAVLALGDDFDVPMAVGDGLLDAFLEDARIHPDAFFRPGDDDGGFVGHDLSFMQRYFSFPINGHIGCRDVPPHPGRRSRSHRTCRSAATSSVRAAPRSSSIPYRN